MTIILTDDQVTRVRAALKSDVEDSYEEALSILDGAQRVEVVGTFQHKYMTPEGTREAVIFCDEEFATDTPLYAVKETK